MATMRLLPWLLLHPCSGDMYDTLHAERTVAPTSCPSGCARWAHLAQDGSRQQQEAADRMWVGPVPASAACALPGRSVQCCNMFNSSLVGIWPNCAPLAGGSKQLAAAESPQAEARGAAATGELAGEYADKAGLHDWDSPMCYPQFPSDKGSLSPGFNGAFCWCKDPEPGGAAWGLCMSPAAKPEELNIQLASPTSVVVSFVTFDEPPGSAATPPEVSYREQGAPPAGNRVAKGVTHVYRMPLGPPAVTNATKRYFLHFVRLSNLHERTAYSYSVQSGSKLHRSAEAEFTSLYSSGETRLCLFGDSESVLLLMTAAILSL